MTPRPRRRPSTSRSPTASSTPPTSTATPSGGSRRHHRVDGRAAVGAAGSRRRHRRRRRREPLGHALQHGSRRALRGGPGRRRHDRADPRRDSSARPFGIVAGNDGRIYVTGKATPNSPASMPAAASASTRRPVSRGRSSTARTAISTSPTRPARGSVRFLSGAPRATTVAAARVSRPTWHPRPRPSTRAATRPRSSSTTARPPPTARTSAPVTLAGGRRSRRRSPRSPGSRRRHDLPRARADATNEEGTRRPAPTRRHDRWPPTARSAAHGVELR